MARKIRAKRIPELREQGMPRGPIAATRHMSMESVCGVFDQAGERHVHWGGAREMTGGEVCRMLCPDKHLRESVFHEPDWDYVRKEMAKVGVNLRPLHGDYRRECASRRLMATGSRGSAGATATMPPPGRSPSCATSPSRISTRRRLRCEGATPSAARIRSGSAKAAANPCSAKSGPPSCAAVVGRIFGRVKIGGAGLRPGASGIGPLEEARRGKARGRVRPRASEARVTALQASGGDPGPESRHGRHACTAAGDGGRGAR